MTQKTLNKMNKFCKMKKIAFGQLLFDILTYSTFDSLSNITDKELEKRFNEIYLKEKPIKVHGGYYPVGHPKTKDRTVRPMRVPHTG